MMTVLIKIKATDSSMLPRLAVRPRPTPAAGRNAQTQVLSIPQPFTISRPKLSTTPLL